MPFVALPSSPAALALRGANVAQRKTSCAASQVTVIGAGAAGLTAAFFAAEAGAKVKTTRLSMTLKLEPPVRCCMLSTLAGTALQELGPNARMLNQHGVPLSCSCNHEIRACFTITGCA